MGISPVTVRLRAGRYNAEASAAGYALLESLTVGSDEAQSVDWVLESSDVSGTATPTDSKTQFRNTVRWTALGVALASLATTAYLPNETEEISNSSNTRTSCL